MGEAYERGIILYNQGRYKQAAEEFRRELAVNNRLPLAHSMLGMSLLFDGDAKGGESKIDIGLQLGPDQGYCHYARASLVLNPRHVEMERKNRKRFRYSKIRNRNKEAKQHVVTAIELDPKKVSYFTLLAALEFDARKWDASIAASRKGLELDPFNERSAILLARALSRKAYFIEAGRVLEKVLRDNPLSSDGHREYAWNLIETGKADQAADHFRESVRLDPTQTGAADLLVQARRLRLPLYSYRLRFGRGYTRRVSPRARRFRFVLIYVGIIFICELLQSQNALNAQMYSGIMTTFTILIVVRAIRNLRRKR